MAAHTGLFIGGLWRDGKYDRRGDVYAPATGEKIATYAIAEEPDLEDAVEAASCAFLAWRDTSAHVRARVLRKAGEIYRARAAELAPGLSLEMGKPQAEARAELLSVADIFDWFAGEALRTYGQVIPSRSPSVTQMALKQPVGPVAAFTPWNFPVSQLARKVAAALAAGCTLVAKPPEDTPAAPAEMANIFKDAGLPDGVLNLVYGVPPEVSAYLVPHPKIRKISFTGSVPVGKQIAAMAGQHMKRITMELGGHNPVVVCADADIEQAAKAIAAFKYRNAGQVCISPSRILVERTVLEPFTEAYHAETIAVQRSSAEPSAAGLGPLVSERRISAVEDLVREAVSMGAKAIAGGSRQDGPGFYFEPTILVDVPQHAKIMNEEPFGPVSMLQPFDTLEEAITESNRLAYGLSAFCFTQSIRTSQLLQNELETGMLAINHTLFGLPETHLGGVKDSGYGSEGGSEAILSYLVTKFVTQDARIWSSLGN